MSSKRSEIRRDRRRRIKLLKLPHMTRGRLIVLAENLLLSLSRLHARFKERRAVDLAPNEAANLRHQRSKSAWARKKRKLLDLLEQCRQYVPPELADAIKYEFDHEEFLWQKKEHRTKPMQGEMGHG